MIEPIIHSVAESMEDFILFMKPLETIAVIRGYFINIISAQVAQETAWGHKIIGKNLFNIKSMQEWVNQGKPTAEAWTTEYIHGKPIKVKARFRDYVTYGDSLEDYILLIQKPWFREAWINRLDPEKYFNGLVKGGYATDPVYADSLLRRYDKICELMLSSLKIITEYSKK